MGYAITWCAVRETDAQKLLDRLQLTPTGETEEEPESLISSAKLDSGWRILWYNKNGCPFLRPSDLRELSREQDLLLCLVEEHCMASSAEFWRNGSRVWWISHQGEDGPKGLDVDGVPPDCFAGIKRDQEGKQEADGGEESDVDYLFDIPLQVAQSLIGFKHDENYPLLNDERFVVLSRSARKQGFLGRLFGK